MSGINHLDSNSLLGTQLRGTYSEVDVKSNFDTLDRAVHGSHNKGELVLENGTFKTINTHTVFTPLNTSKTTIEQNRKVRTAVFQMLERQFGDKSQTFGRLEVARQHLLLSADNFRPITREEVKAMIDSLKNAEHADILDATGLQKSLERFAEQKAKGTNFSKNIRDFAVRYSQDAATFADKVQNGVSNAFAAAIRGLREFYQHNDSSILFQMNAGHEIEQLKSTIQAIAEKKDINQPDVELKAFDLLKREIHQNLSALFQIKMPFEALTSASHARQLQALEDQILGISDKINGISSQLAKLKPRTEEYQDLKQQQSVLSAQLTSLQVVLKDTRTAHQNVETVRAELTQEFDVQKQALLDKVFANFNLFGATNLEDLFRIRTGADQLLDDQIETRIKDFANGCQQIEDWANFNSRCIQAQLSGTITRGGNTEVYFLRDYDAVQNNPNTSHYRGFMPFDEYSTKLNEFKASDDYKSAQSTAAHLNRLIISLNLPNVTSVQPFEIETLGINGALVSRSSVNRERIDGKLATVEATIRELRAEHSQITDFNVKYASTGGDQRDRAVRNSAKYKFFNFFSHRAAEKLVEEARNADIQRRVNTSSNLKRARELATGILDAIVLHSVLRAMKGELDISSSVANDILHDRIDPLEFKTNANVTNYLAAFQLDDQPQA